MKIKLVIFDLDGTLVDTIEGIAISMNLVLETRNLPTHSILAYKKFVGNGLRQLVITALPESFRDEKTVELAYIELLEHYRTHFTQGLSVYPGISELLDELTNQKIILGVNTNKNQEMTDWIMSNLFSQWKFVKIIGVDSGFAKKPHPSAVLSIVEQVGVKPEECLFIGDSEVDYHTAKNAGVKCVLVSWGFRSQEELSVLQHEHMIHLPVEFLKHL